jgi:hypothetical protein
MPKILGTPLSFRGKSAYTPKLGPPARITLRRALIWPKDRPGWRESYRKYYFDRCASNPVVRKSSQVYISLIHEISTLRLKQQVTRAVGFRVYLRRTLEPTRKFVTSFTNIKSLLFSKYFAYFFRTILYSDFSGWINHSSGAYCSRSICLEKLRFSEKRVTKSCKQAIPDSMGAAGEGEAIEDEDE